MAFRGLRPSTSTVNDRFVRFYVLRKGGIEGPLSIVASARVASARTSSMVVEQGRI